MRIWWQCFRGLGPSQALEAFRKAAGVFGGYVPQRLPDNLLEREVPAIVAGCLAAHKAACQASPAHLPTPAAIKVAVGADWISLTYGSGRSKVVVEASQPLQHWTVKVEGPPEAFDSILSRVLATGLVGAQESYWCEEGQDFIRLLENEVALQEKLAAAIGRGEQEEASFIRQQLDELYAKATPEQQAFLRDRRGYAEERHCLLCSPLTDEQLGEISSSLLALCDYHGVEQELHAARARIQQLTELCLCSCGLSDHNERGLCGRVGHFCTPISREASVGVGRLEQLLDDAVATLVSPPAGA